MGQRESGGYPRKHLPIKADISRVIMRKILFIICAGLFLHYSAVAIAGSSHGAIYRGLEPAIATIDDTIRILGIPTSRIVNKDNIICKYHFVEVSIDKKTRKVIAIMIYDPTFKDVNRVMINDPFDKISRELNLVGSGGVIYDKNKGVVYIFNSDNNLESIIYGNLTK